MVLANIHFDQKRLDIKVLILVLLDDGLGQKVDY